MARECVVCGRDQRYKKVWEAYGSGRAEKVICMACGPEWTFDREGRPRRIQAIDPYRARRGVGRG